MYSLLHLPLVDITSSDSLQLPAKYLSHLTESLVSRLDETRSVSSEQTQTQTALDRFGQIVAAALAGDKASYNQDAQVTDYT